MIQDAAVETAAEWLPHSGDCEVRPERDCTCWQSRVNIMRAALEAAAPHLLSHEREETRLAHLDAVVNARTVDKLERELAEAKEQRQNEIQAEVLIHARSVISQALATAEKWRYDRVCADFQEMIGAAQAGKLRKP